MTKKIIKKFLHSCRHVVSASLLILPLLIGCSEGGDTPDTPPAPSTPVEKEYITLDLSVGVNNGGSSTRAAFTGDGSFEAPVSKYETVNTLRVVIVRPNGKIEHNRIVTVSEDYRKDDNNIINSYYIINDNLRFNVIPDETKTIYLFANEKTVSRNNKFDFTSNLIVGRDFPKETIENMLIKRESNKAFINNGSSTPNLDKSYIPMSECFEVVIPPTSGNVEDLFAETLFITRSLIKFSFHVSISDDAVEYFTDSKIKLMGVMISNLSDKCYYLPKNTTYNPEKEIYTPLNGQPSRKTPVNREITSFAMPEDPEASYCIFDFDEPLSLDNKGIDTSSPRLYLPETKTDEKYWVKLMFSNPTQDELYASQPLELVDIPRNTHVKVNMTITKKDDLSATVEVLPWDREDHYVDYTANVGITDEGCLKFSGDEGQSGDYLSLNKEAAQLVLNYGKVAQGSFTIASPVGETWDAYLITTGGTTDAIQFQIPDPENETETITTTHISGIIGKEAKFGIVATVAPGTEQNSAQLIVMATLATGTQVIVDVLKNWKSTSGILTVIENPNQ